MGRAVAAVATLGGSEVVRGAIAVKKKLIDDPANAREEALNIQKQQVADAAAQQSEFELKQENADTIAKAAADNKRKRAAQQVAGMKGRSSTILTGPGAAPAAAAASIIPPSSILGG